MLLKSSSSPFDSIDEEETDSGMLANTRANLINKIDEESESESECSFDDDEASTKKKKSDIDRSIDEYEAACYYLKIVPCKIVFKSLPTSSIILSNYGLTSTSVLALTQALKVFKVYFSFKIKYYSILII